MWPVFFAAVVAERHNRFRAIAGMTGFPLSVRLQEIGEAHSARHWVLV